MNVIWRQFTKPIQNLPNIINVQQRGMVQAKKRFYKNVTVTGSNGNYEVNLDNRKLKTPNGHTFQVPNEALAMAVANEWACTKENIVPAWMHLSSLSFTVADNPNHLTKYDIASKTLEYIETDTLLYRDDSNEEVIKAQSDHWDPVLNWFNNKFNINLTTSTGINVTEIPSDTEAILKRYILSHNIWAATGFWYGTEVLKSFILTVAAVERYMSVEDAVALSRLEVNYQASKWGSVEWAHDLDKYDLQARFSAAILFIHLNSSDYAYKKKSKA